MSFYKFKMLPSQWYKRVNINSPPKEIQYFLIGKFFELEENSQCTIQIKYKGETKDVLLTGRVTQNPISKKWIVCGINPHGDYILLEVIFNEKLEGFKDLL